MLLSSKRLSFAHGLMGGAVALALFASPLSAQTPAPASPAAAETAAPAAKDPATVIAKGDGFTVTQGDVEMMAKDAAFDLKDVPEQQKYELIVNVLIDLKSMAVLAQREKLDQSEEYKRLAEYAITKTLSDEYLQSELKKRVTDEALKKLYDTLVAQLKPEEEIRASHILVKTEEEAKKVVERLAAGEDFSAIAKEVSTDPTAAMNGGELGYFTRERMVPEFADAAFAMEVGKTSAPVKTSFGWHVILLQDKRPKQPPTFEEIKSQLEAYQSRLAQQEISKEIRETLKVERLDQPKPEPAPDLKVPAPLPEESPAAAASASPAASAAPAASEPAASEPAKP
ncbi:MAG: peptidylprolyl isomerase [Methylobacteriaceae bacterium]|nr:peptidylprolyl isomerase [Methylobacteriaceae bacterium]